MIKPVAAKIKSSSEGKADGSGTSGVSGMPIPTQVMARKRGHRINEMVRTLEQYKNQTSFLLAGCQCCDTIGWSVAKTFMRVMPPNVRTQARPARDVEHVTRARSGRCLKCAR